MLLVIFIVFSKSIIRKTERLKEAKEVEEMSTSIFEPNLKSKRAGGAVVTVAEVIFLQYSCEILPLNFLAFQ